MRASSRRASATSAETHAAVMVSQRQGNCVSRRGVSTSQTGLLRGVAIRNATSATTDGASAARLRARNRTTAGAAMSSVYVRRKVSHQSPISLGEGWKMKFLL